MHPKRYFNNVFAFISSLGVRVGLFGLLGFIDAGRGGPFVGIDLGLALIDALMTGPQCERLRARLLDRAAARGSRPLAPA